MSPGPILPNTILVVEDAPETRELITGFLEDQGFRVVPAATCGEALACLSGSAPAGRPDLVLLDISLPDGDGLTLAGRLRREGQPPIVFVTGRDGDEDRIRGLEAGDDYVTKPINLRELLARVRNVLRRTAPGPAKEPALDFAGWRIDLIRREVFRPNGTLLPLTAGEFNILAALAAARPQPVERTILLDVISNRDPTTVKEHTIETLVGRLRRKMRGADGAEPPIVTVRGVGYALADPPPAGQP